MISFKKTCSRLFKLGVSYFLLKIILIAVLSIVFLKGGYLVFGTSTCPFPMVGNFYPFGGPSGSACEAPKGLTTVENGSVQLGRSEINNRSYTIQMQASSTLIFNPSYFIKLMDATSSILIGGKPSEIKKGYFCASDTDNDGCYVVQAAVSLPCPNSGKRYYDLTLLTSPYMLEDCNPNNNQQCGLLSEACDGIDNNCNGLVDEGSGTFNLLQSYQPRAWHSAVLANDTKMIIFGGIDDYEGARADVLIYDFIGGFWSVGKSANQLTAGHTAVVNPNDNRMYVYGGDDFGSLVYNSLLVYDITNDVWLPNGPSGPGPRTNHSAVFYNNKMYVYGGALYRTGSRVQGSLFIYDFNANSWSSGPSYLPRAFHGAAVYQDKMYVYGGYEDHAFPNYPTGSMLIFDFNANGGLGQWSVGIGSSQPSGMSPVAVNLNKFYAFSFNSIHTFDFTTNQWTYGPVWRGGIESIYAPSGVFRNNKFYIYGGEAGNGSYVDSTFIEFVPCAP